LPWAPAPDLRHLKEEGRDFGEGLVEEIIEKKRARKYLGAEAIVEGVLSHCPWPIYSRGGSAWRDGVNEALIEHRAGLGIRV
jgi:hypothetical protein